jgi:hypothetical protein
MQCFRSFHTAERTIEGVEALHILRKGEVKRVDGRDAIKQAKFIKSLFGVAAQRELPECIFLPQSNPFNTIKRRAAAL